tara:strand:+ start:2374 stop:3636 length:1263 start_codon:yes stop_codon:yes gene_type:complete
MENTIDILREHSNILWTCLAAFLVFFMQAGFTLVEAGFTRAKNVCNIVMKNLMDMSIGSLIFWMFGFGLMFGVSNGFIGTSFFFFDGSSEAAKSVGSSVGFNWAFLLFQTVFCATAATIVSGAVAERTKFGSYVLFSLLICGIIYPIFGSWAWGSLYAGEGWLEKIGFLDFAGSTVVHSIGGWAALAGAIVVGARKGKYLPDGRMGLIAPHNVPMGALGVFILWLGWFGFNAGSTTSVGGDLAKIALITNLAACAGVMGSLMTNWIFSRRVDPTLSLNGALAGLVSITAGCDIFSPAMAVCVGLLGGQIVVLSVIMFDRLKIDDPVGAISVHGVCGAWGTLAIGLFSEKSGLQQLGIQFIGILSAFVWAFGISYPVFLMIQRTIGLRVDEREELEGLDLTEHGISGYEGIPTLIRHNEMG